MHSKIKPSRHDKFNLLQLPKQIFKFGGSSLTSAKCYRKVARIISHHLAPNDLVVVSASGRTTDWLTAIAEQRPHAQEILQKVRYHHQGIIQDSVSNSAQKRLLKTLENDCQWIQRLIDLKKTQNQSNNIIALGELWSAQILSAILDDIQINASWIDARQFLMLQRCSDHYQVNLQSSQSYLHELLKSRQERISVVTGFIASDSDRNTVTLGRNGSDYTATLIARLTSALKVTIWTDVAGVFNFDPNLSDSATPLEEVNVDLLQTLSDLGSPVIHQKTLKPLKQTKINLSLRSTFAPEQKGTQVCQNNSYHSHAIVTHKNDLCRIKITTEDELSCQRLLHQLGEFASAALNQFSVIEKISSKVILLIVEQSKKSFWLQCIQEVHEAQTTQESLNCSLLALVTEHSEDKPYHQLFLQQFLNNESCANQLLKKDKSFVAIIDQTCIDALAIRCFHQWQNFQSIKAICLLGVGNVGATWHSIWQRKLKQQPLNGQQVILTANSKTLTLLNSGEAFSEIKNSEDAIVRLLQHAPFKQKLVIDATSSDLIAQTYEQFIRSGAHIISANKINSAGPEANYQRLMTLARNCRRRWLQNATIGAGLPINDALKNLLDTGDRIESVRGVFSGTLSWLLQSYTDQSKLSELIQTAKNSGYSEPDPRLDLAGTDVARKLVIAARLAGFQLELHEIACSPFLSAQWLTGTEKDFANYSEAIDQEFHQRWISAQSEGKRLVYQAKFTPKDGARCELIALEQSDPLCQISPCDNIFEIKSQWYQDNPLIIRGPGAGREVTGAAIQSDLNKIWQ